MIYDKKNIKKIKNNYKVITLESQTPNSSNFYFKGVYSYLESSAASFTSFKI